MKKKILPQRKIQLSAHQAATSVYIDAEITAEGDLVLAGQDIGQAPSKIFGDSDHEYWLKIPASRKDDVLLALLETLYKDDLKAISNLQKLLEARSIPCEFSSY